MNSVTSGTTIVNNSGQTVYIYEYTILYYSIVIYKTRQTSGNEAWMGSPAIIDDGNNYNVQHDCKTGANDCYITPPPTPSPKPMTQSVPEHTHDWVEGVVYEATPISDGLEGTYCRTCGTVRESHPISAYEYSLNDYAEPKINAAKFGQDITFDFGEWNSFPKSFMEKLVAKSAQGVTFVFKYKWNHKLQTITIPAGTPIDLNFDYYGPAKMAELYGAN